MTEPILRRSFLAFVALATWGCAPGAGPVPLAPAALVDDVAAATQLLERERAALRDGRTGSTELARMVRLGMWEEAEAALGRGGGSAEARIAEAELRFRQHRYEEAGRLVEAVLGSAPNRRDARLLAARLEVQAWRLPAAAAAAERLLVENPRDEEAALLLGRIRLLEKRYDEALEWSKRVAGWNPRSAGAHLLEADVRFWNQDPAGAEAPLRRALELDPFDPDARFSYGYAIWRRVDATQLDAMADQWNLALAVDPLHYVTHWHWGNGHTNLTYADYVQPTDSLVRARLARADTLIAARRSAEAIELARAVERETPESVLPAMLRGSAFYMAWDMDRATRLDSAQAIFEGILRRKRNYGPAHNALAAIIKQRQFTVLAAYDSLEAEIARTPIPPDPMLAEVFPEIRYYPGDRVEKMVRLELGPSLAYLPLIRRQGRRYRIPPLHQDLAQAMGRSYFRTATTFDNRQWMDIRGVGSGAAAIEYVERGAHQERNVLLHEYVHLFHGIVFTDAESRRVRELYHDAMREGRTLDYYASNNESEFLAQAYPAFLSPVKVHPLNHKSMNTHDDLRRKDPATYAWIDSLIAKQRAYLAGDRSAFRSNWAQVYVNLSEEARADEEATAATRDTRGAVLLDSALVWDPAYLPAMISYAALHRDAGRWEEAERWLARAESVDPSYAPTFAARADVLGARARAGGDATGAVARRADLLRVALRHERDLAERASLSQALRELYRSHGMLPEAVAAAEEYAREAPTISTYLRDRKDEAEAYALSLRAAAGYATASVPALREMVARKPQNYALRTQFADALLTAGSTDEAAATLEEAQRILRAGGSADAGFAARLAQLHLSRGDTVAARAALQPVLDSGRPQRDHHLVRALVAVGLVTEANVRLAEIPEARTPQQRAESAFTRASLHSARGDGEMAERELRAAIAADPYHLSARLRLIALLRDRGATAEADAVAAAGGELPLPLGPDFTRSTHSPRSGRSAADQARNNGSKRE